MPNSCPSAPTLVLGAALTFGLGAAGCGGDTEISGLYQTTEALRDASGCGPGTSTTTPAFVRVQQGSLFGASFYSVKACSGREDTTCRSEYSELLASGALGTPIDGGFTGGFDAASGLGVRCALTHVEVKATRAGDVLTLEGTRRTGEVMVPSAECLSDLAKARASELSCVAFERVVGNRIGDVPKAEGLDLGF
jgi:hypothetical protein